MGSTNTSLTVDIDEMVYFVVANVDFIPLDALRFANWINGFIWP